MKSTRTTILFAAGVLVLWLSCGPVTADPTLDLSIVKGASGSIDGAYFEQWWDQSAGVGVFKPFVRIQANGTEEAYNTDNTIKDLDAVDKGGTNWRHSLLLTPEDVANGYWEFWLDFDEQKNATERYLSLDELKIYLEDSPDLTGWPDNFHDPVYDLNPGSGDENWIKLNVALNSGGLGIADMLARIPIPASLPAGRDYVYLYSKFGVQIASDDGPEMWCIRTIPIPAPGAIVLGSIGVGLVGWLRRSRSL